MKTSEWFSEKFQALPLIFRSPALGLLCSFFAITLVLDRLGYVVKHLLWVLLAFVVLTLCSFYWFRKHLRLTSDIERASKSLQLSTVLAFSVLLSLYVGVLIVWPLGSYFYSLFFEFAIPTPFNLYGIVMVALGLWGFAMVWFLSGVIENNGHQKFWKGFFQFDNWLLVTLLPKGLRKDYQIHIQWRFRVWGRQILRWWQRLRMAPALKKLRPLWVLMAAGFSLLLTCWLVTGWPLDYHAKTPVEWLRDELKEKPANTGAWSLLTVLAGASIAFVLWWFRDTNQLWQIENQRKDINLKDFQKLSEWASGLHLVEAQSTEFKEWNEGTQGRNFKRVQSTVMPAPQQASANTAHAHSRAEGAASLQIAAVYQLQAFLQGEYGPQFQRPAFALLLSLWSAIMQRPAGEWKVEYTQALGQQGARSKEPEVQAFKNWKDQVQSAASTPLAQAITQVLAADHGYAMLQFIDNLPGANLAGMNAHWPGIELPLELAHQNLSGIQAQAAQWRKSCLEGADLSWAHLEGADLRAAHLEGADLRSAHLEGADLRSAHLEGADLHWAHLEGADLRGAHLKGAAFWNTHLEGVTLWDAHLEDTQLSAVHLEGADLSWAYLNGVQLINVRMPDTTLFTEARTDAGTLVCIQARIDGKSRTHPLATHAQRLWLRDACRLRLVDAAYTEYEQHWRLATPEQKARAEAIARDPSLLNDQDFKGLPNPSLS